MKHPWALGRPAREVWSEFWDDVLRPLLEGVLNTGEAFWASDYPFFLQRYGYPEETYFDISYDPVRDESGRAGGVFCIVSETTGRVIGERRLRILRDTGKVAGQADDADAALLRIAEVLGQHPKDLPFALLYRLDGPGKAPRCVAHCGIGPQESFIRPLAEAASGRELVLDTDSLQHCGPLPGGPWPEQVRNVVVLPLSVPGQTPSGFLVAAASPRLPFDEDYRDFLRLIASNIVAALSAAETLAQERARSEILAEIDRVKTTFFSNISHEFRTPLTLMLGPVEDILNGSASTLSRPERQKLEVTHRNALRLMKLVNALLDFSRLEAGRMQASYAPLDLSKLTAELASTFRSAVEKAGLELIVDCPPLPQPVYVDREMWEKIMLNLLSNALKFTFSGEIAVRLRWSGDGPVLTVQDTGTGIDAAYLPQVFERFYRVPNARSRTHEGSGIGLSLVYELVKLHDGEITVESEVSRGTRFQIRLKAGEGHLPKDRVEARRAATRPAMPGYFADGAQSWLGSGSDESVTDPRPSDKRPARILWADDNADMRDYVAEILSPYWTIEAVADGAAALERARREPPDLVLADVMMPKLDGFGLLHELRADERTCALPVILLSARAGEEAKIEGLDAGADDYLIKPFTARELIARVRAHLEMSRARKEFAARQFESEAWFRIAVEAARFGVWEADPGNWSVRIDANLTRMLRLESQKTELSLEEWRDMVHPLDRDHVVEEFGACASGARPLAIECRVNRADGEVRWLRAHGDVVHRTDTVPARIVGVIQDITTQKKAVEIQNLLVNELNHRVRNTLATVLSLARQTASRATSLAGYIEGFESRLMALASAHSLLSRSNWNPVPLRDVVSETLAPHSTGGALQIDGPDCELNPQHALALTLGLHELATNACKYGALTSPAGRIQIGWSRTACERGHLIQIHWRELGGPQVEKPRRHGFGTQLLEKALASDLGGKVELQFEPAGLSCSIGFTVE